MHEMNIKGLEMYFVRKEVQDACRSTVAPPDVRREPILSDGFLTVCSFLTVAIAREGPLAKYDTRVYRVR